MNETKHTEGDWTLADGKVIMGKRHDGESIAVGIAFGIIEYGDQRDRDTAAANANVMTAAPTLLAALEALVSAPLRYNGNSIEIDCASHSDAIGRVWIARLAIALATGSAAKGGAK